MSNNQINLMGDSVSEKSEDEDDKDYMNSRKSQKLDSDQDLEVDQSI
jgi:hypothetical protein